MYLPNYKNSGKQATIKNQKLYVITGGPGVGKTILLNYLESRGFTTVQEDAREIIKNQMKGDGDGGVINRPQLFDFGVFQKQRHEFGSAYLKRNTVDIA